MTETKERTPLALPDPSEEAEQFDPSLEGRRAALASEWRAATPRTPAQISRFYQHAHGIGPELEAWHALPERQEWTKMLVHVAQESAAGTIVDIGAGMGHDLLAIRPQLPLSWHYAVEPNDVLRRELRSKDIECSADVAEAPVETADLLICIDVLEHVPDPESFLAGIAQRAPLGCLLFETTATHDTGTPLHLVANRGWHPGRVLERHGWELADHSGRVRVWRRTSEAGAQRASLLLCAYRSVALRTLESLLDLCAGPPGGNKWRLKVKGGDALIARSRNIILTDWYRSTNDAVALMVDDDIVFSAADADRLSELCRNGHDIICGAYPVHDGAHLACRFLPGTGEVSFGPAQAPLEIQYAASGFMAVHRRVLDALCRMLALCHADQSWSFYPLFESRVLLAENEAEGAQSVHQWLSEDYAFSERARRAGFKVWLDPQTRLEHRGEAGLSITNMTAMHAAMQQV